MPSVLLASGRSARTVGKAKSQAAPESFAAPNEERYLLAEAQLTMVHYLPSTDWATLLLGMVIATADTPQRKAIAAACVLGYAAMTALVFSSFALAFLAGFGLLLIFASRLTIPRPLAWLAFTLSGASLFIYLTHFHWAALLRTLGMGGSPALSVAVALVGGVLAWAAWQRLVPAAGGRDATAAS